MLGRNLRLKLDLLKPPPKTTKLKQNLASHDTQHHGRNVEFVPGEIVLLIKLKHFYVVFVEVTPRRGGPLYCTNEGQSPEY